MYRRDRAGYKPRLLDIREATAMRLSNSRPAFFRSFLVAGLVALGTSQALAAGAKIKIAGQSDLPRFSYAVSGSASQLVEADAATFDAFAAKVRADIDSTLANYDIADPSTVRRLLGVELDLQELAGDDAAALKTVDALRALEEKPAGRLLGYLYSRARLQAALDAGGHSGTAYEQAFRKRYRADVADLPWALVQDGIKSGYATSRLNSRAATLGDVATELDPAVARSGALDAPEAWALIAARNNLRSSLPLSLARSEVLHDYIATHDVARPDIWAAREVTLSSADRLTPVNVAIWDSGIDTTIFPTQLFTDAQPTASGMHGLAFDDTGHPSPDWLYPLSSAEQKAYPGFRDEIKGFDDLQNGIDSAEATSTQMKFATYSPAQMHELNELDKVLGFYIHGTHCAGIAVRGNPAARLVVARFNDQLSDLGFAPDRAMGASAWAWPSSRWPIFFRTRNVRVVNMSWGDDVPRSSRPGSRRPAAVPILSSARSRRRRCSRSGAKSVETAIRSAPGTLFVAAAGNSDDNTAFIGDVPASLNLPNLVSVGAVNQAGDETSFTSHGDTVVVHADGYQVDSFVPGGARLKLSGTSMATPNVVNLAAKLFALDPSLTPAQAIDLIRGGATNKRRRPPPSHRREALGGAAGGPRALTRHGQ